MGVSSRTELLYLTMSNPQARGQNSLSAEEEEGLPALLKAAEAGHSWAQIRLIEHYGKRNGNAADPVTAYMWCLLSEKTAASMRNQIESSKTNLGRIMSPQQLADAEQRAAEWQNNTKKKSGFAEAEDQSGKVKMAVGIP